MPTSTAPTMIAMIAPLGSPLDLLPELEAAAEPVVLAEVVDDALEDTVELGRAVTTNGVAEDCATSGTETGEALVNDDDDEGITGVLGRCVVCAAVGDSPTGTTELDELGVMDELGELDGRTLLSVVQALEVLDGSSLDPLPGGRGF